MLANFMRQTHADRFAWGQNDCALWCASAVKLATGFDPACGLRGTYRTGFECRRMIAGAGGLCALIAPRMDAIHALKDLNGEGVAIAKVGSQELCGLVVSGRLVSRMATGLRFDDEFEILRGWSW
jgi:hypothetical protein